MPRGGARPGAGRKKNSGRAARAAEHAIRVVAKSKKSPLEYLLHVMTHSPDENRRFEAAKAAAPYVHPRLQAIEHSGEIVSKHEQMLDELEQLVGSKRPQLELSATESTETDVVH